LSRARWVADTALRAGGGARHGKGGGDEQGFFLLSSVIFVSLQDRVSFAFEKQGARLQPEDPSSRASPTNARTPSPPHALAPRTTSSIRAYKRPGIAAAAFARSPVRELG
jgi:hypothetical protein